MCIPTVHQRRTSALAVATLLLWPATTMLAQHASPTLWRTVDKTVVPGDDFFAYANGGWLKTTTIPVGKERWGARDIINDLTRQRVVALIDDGSNAPLGSNARKVFDYRAALLNESAIDKRGIAPLKPLFDAIARVQDKTALTRLLGNGMRNDVDPLNYAVYRSAHILGLSVEPSIHGEKTYTPFLVQGGLGLPDREHYVSTDPNMQSLRERYAQYIGRLFVLAGFDSAQHRARSVVSLETAIAHSQATREISANDRNADNVWTRADFARLAPGMDWSVFFTAAGLSKQDTFVAWQPSAVKGVAALVESQLLDSWKDYLRFEVINTRAHLLPLAFAELSEAFHADVMDKRSREQRAFDATQLAMGDALGQMYAGKYFPPEQKARVDTIVSNVAAAFARRVEASTWMTPESKATALAKLKVLYVGIGYPEHWQDYSDLVVDRNDAFGNAQRVADRNYHRSLALLGQPIDMKDWWIGAQTAGAILIFQQNAYEFSAALLQSPKFDPAASDAANYGAIGVLIGHDINHFIDLLGAEYHVDGSMRAWWSPQDRQRFAQLTEPLANQFSSYHPFPDATVDGKLTLSENVADLAGLTVAFDAYRRTLGNRATDEVYVRQQDREFFLAYAQSSRVKMSDAGMRAQLTNDHAPETYRAATVRNFDAWYSAFDVRPGQRLYLAPANRVRIW